MLAGIGRTGSRGGRIGPSRTFRDVTVVPYAELLDSGIGGREHVGGPIWPTWRLQRLARYKRYGWPFDHRPQPPATPPDDLPGEYAWCGAAVDHFGQLVRDFSTRILASRRAFPDAVLLFGLREQPQLARAGRTSRSLWSILDWYGVPRERVAFVDRPVRVETLHVCDQQEQLGVGPSRTYLAALEANAARRLPPAERSGTVYVSRARLPARGSILGETVLEDALAAAGARIVHPETMPLAEQLAAYASAERLVFAEGSAMHGCQLLGRQLGDVFVINRRARSRLGIKFVAPRARSLRHLDFVRGAVTDILPNGRPLESVAAALLDGGAVLRALADAGLDLDVPAWEAAFREGVAADAEAWARARLAARRVVPPVVREHIAGSLAAAGLDPSIVSRH